MAILENKGGAASLPKNGEDVRLIRDTVRSVMEQFGPRLAGTPACLGAARVLGELMGEACDRSWLQPFPLHPGSFWRIPAAAALGFILAFLFHLPGWNLISLLVLSAGFLYALVHFIFLGDLFDGLFAKKEGLNVAAVIEPVRKAQRQILLCAHHDSALRCRFLEKRQILYPFRMIPAMVLYGLTTASFGVMQLPAPAVQAALKAAVPYLMALGLWFILPFFFFYRAEASPGAGDNLLGSAILVRMTQLFGRGGKRPASTRLILVSHDGEEIGMRGARAFLRKHRQLLDSCPLTVVNIDSLHRLEDLTLLESDRNGLVPLSAGLNRKLKDVFQTEGLAVKGKKLPLGGGGTDAAVYAAAGYDAASLIGISTALIRRGLVYHTRLDDEAHLDSRIIEGALIGLCRTVQVLDQPGS